MGNAAFRKNLGMPHLLQSYSQIWCIGGCELS